MENSIRVSVICNAYNHEKYIRDALEGFVMQKTDFAFEVLIHDDASTDSTATIIREYEAKYPDLIKPIYQTENQYSQSVPISAVYHFPRAKGDYIAFCEGDDYWTDPLKLQKQFDAMEAHPEVDICAHAAPMLDASTGKLLRTIAPRTEECVIPVEDVIMGEGGFVVTNSLMYRFELTKDPPAFRENFRYDYSLQILGSLRGGMLFLPEQMSVYRYMSIGSWSEKRTRDKAFRETLLERKQRMLRELNEYTEGKYEETIDFRMLKNEFEHYFAERDFKIAFDKKYQSVYRKNGWKGYLKWRLKAAIPFLAVIVRKLKRKH